MFVDLDYLCIYPDENYKVSMLVDTFNRITLIQVLALKYQDVLSLNNSPAIKKIIIIQVLFFSQIKLN